MIAVRASEKRPRPVVLCILAGWGYRPRTADTAVALAGTPNWKRIAAANPHALLNTSGRQVGLPDGQMGNSEVGHMNLGAGRVVMQELVRITASIADGAFFKIPAFVEACRRVRESGGTLHLL